MKASSIAETSTDSTRGHFAHHLQREENRTSEQTNELCARNTSVACWFAPFWRSCDADRDFTDAFTHSADIWHAVFFVSFQRCAVTPAILNSYGGKFPEMVCCEAVAARAARVFPNWRTLRASSLRVYMCFAAARRLAAFAKQIVPKLSERTRVRRIQLLSDIIKPNDSRSFPSSFSSRCVFPFEFRASRPSAEVTKRIVSDFLSCKRCNLKYLQNSVRSRGWKRKSLWFKDRDGGNRLQVSIILAELARRNEREFLEAISRKLFLSRFHARMAKFPAEQDRQKSNKTPAIS